MALKYSFAIRNFLQNFGPMKLALQNGVMIIRSGAEPANADAADTGTLLCTVTLASGARTAEVLSSGTLTITGGGGGTLDTLTVNSVSIISAAVAWNTDTATTAEDIKNNINAYRSSPGYIASRSGSVVTIKALPGTGTGPNTYVVAATYTTMTGSTANLSGGVAAVNGLTFSYVTTGALVKASGVWSGVNVATGTAGYFRILGSVTDAGALCTEATSLIRIQGSCGTSGADYNMNSTALTSGATHTVDTFSFTLPANL